MTAARRHDDSALEWVVRVETHKHADLEHPGHGWITLDRNIAAAFAYISHGELGRALTLHSNACLSQGRSARGRVLLQIVFNLYSSGKNAELMYDSNHIQKVTLHGRAPRGLPKQLVDGAERAKDAARPRHHVILLLQTDSVCQTTGRWTLAIPERAAPHRYVPISIRVSLRLVCDASTNTHCTR